MAILTDLRADEIAKLGEPLGIVPVRAEGVLRGGVNTIFKVTDERGLTWALRVFEAVSQAAASAECDLLVRLADAGVETPAPLRSAELSVRGKPAAWFPWAGGVHRAQREVTVPDVMAVGRALAKIHTAGQRMGQVELGEASGAPMEPEASRFSMGTLKSRLAEFPRERFTPRMLSNEPKLRLLQDRASALSFRSEVIPLIHGDLFRDNVLFGDGESVTVLDFESASAGHPAFDLMVTLLAFCFFDDLSLPHANALVVGYETHRELSRLDRADLWPAGVLACARFMTTRFLDYEPRAAGLSQYKDFMRWHQRYEALVLLGSEALEALGR